MVGFLREQFRQESGAGFAEHTVAACHSGGLLNVQNDSINRAESARGRDMPHFLGPLEKVRL